MKQSIQHFSIYTLGKDEHEAAFYSKRKEFFYDSLASSLGVELAPDCPYSQEVINKFESNIEFLDNGCWRWSGAKGRDGLGRFSIKRDKKILAARASYRIYIKDIGDLNYNWVVRKPSCPTQGCCNPSCLATSKHPSNFIEEFAETGKKYRWKKGCKRKKGSQALGSKINEKQAVEIRVKRLRDNVPFRVLAQEYGISARAIQFIVRGKTWGHVPTILEDCIDYLCTLNSD